MPIEIKLSPESQANLDKVAGSIDNIINKLEVLASKGVKIKNVDVDKIVKELGMLELKEQEIDQKRQERAARDEAIKQRQEASDAARAAKLDARNAKMNTAYEQEKARIEQLRLAYMNLAFAKVKDETATKMALNEYNKAARGMQEVQNQMASTKSQVGGLAMQTSSLTMIMSELPNAGISARVFIMSLSNNILPLTMQFQQLANSVDDTGKRLGNMKALAMFGKSLLGLNAILMVAVSLVVAYSDEIADLVDNLWDATSALNAAELAQKGFNKAMEDSEGKTGKFKSDMMQIKGVLLAVTEGQAVYNDEGKMTNLIWKDSSRALSEYNKIRNLLPKESIKLIEKNGVVDVKAASTEIMKFYNELIVAQGHLQNAEKISEDIIKNQDKVRGAKRAAISDILGIKEDNVTETNLMNFDKNLDGLLKSIEKKTGKSRDELKFTLDEVSMRFRAFSELDGTSFSGKMTKQQYETLRFYTSSKDELKQIAKLQNAYNSELGKSELAIERPDDKKGKKARERTIKEQFEKEIYYNELRARLVEDSAKQAQLIEKENTQEIQMDYAERLNALTKYTSDIAAIADIDKKKSDFDRKEKYEADTRTAKAIYDRNIKYFGENSKEGIKATVQYNQVKTTLDENFRKETLIAEDAYNKTLNDNQRDAFDKSVNLRIAHIQRLEALAEEEARVKGVEYDRANGERTIARIKEQQGIIYNLFQSDTNKRLSDEAFASTQSKITANNELAIKQELAQKKIQIANDEYDKEVELKKKALDDAYLGGDSAAIENAKRELENAEKNTAKILEAYQNADQITIEQKELRDKTLEDMEKEHQQRMLDIREKGFETALKLMKIAEAEYFENKIEAVDKSLEKEKIINKEAIEEQDDLVKKGLQSKEDAAKEKERIQALETSQEKYAAEQKKQIAKDQFMLEQSMMLAKIVVQTAFAVAAINAATKVASATALATIGGAVLIPAIEASGAAQIAQVLGVAAMESSIIGASMLAYEKGGTVPYDTNALVSEKQVEVGERPDGTFFLTPDTPTIMPLKKGTKIYPSIAQSPLAGMDINALETMELNKAINIQVMSNNGYSDKLLMGISSELKENTKAIKNQRLIIPRKSMLEHLRGN